jgi:hypothetical protein
MRGQPIRWRGHPPYPFAHAGYMLAKTPMTLFGSASPRTARRAALAILVVAMFEAPTFADAPANAQERTELSVPRRLHYLFDLSWCTKWQFTCGITCKKVGDGIECKEGVANCNPSFEYYECSDFFVRESCERWSDGCKTCARVSGQIYCTAPSCRGFVPAFRCLKESDG